MASNPWTPAHKAARILEIPRNELHRMRDDGTCELGHHYGAGPLTRSRDTYYWHIPRMKKLMAKQSPEVSFLSSNNQMCAA